MGVTDERITELFDIMLSNVDEEGWCKIPEGISDEEKNELAKRIAVLTMQERIDVLQVGIDEVHDFMNTFKENINDFETLEKLQIKASLDTIKEDFQNILIDLHSEDKISEFFKIDLIPDDEHNKENLENAKKEMVELIDTKFKDSLEHIKEQCYSMIKMTDELNEAIKQTT